MKITIVGRKVNLRDNFKELAEKKLSKFDRIFDEDAEATVTVTVERNRQTVEITIKQRGMIYRAEETTQEMNEALDHVVAALGKQIRRNKTKLERTKKMQPVELTDTYYDEPDEEYQLVRTKRFFRKILRCAMRKHWKSIWKRAKSVRRASKDSLRNEKFFHVTSGQRFG